MWSKLLAARQANDTPGMRRALAKLRNPTEVAGTERLLDLVKMEGGIDLISRVVNAETGKAPALVHAFLTAARIAEDGSPPEGDGGEDA